MIEYVVNFILSPIFYKVLYLTVIGSLTGIIIYAIQKIFDKKISPKWKCAIWLVLVVSLLMPFKFQIKTNRNYAVSSIVDRIENISYVNEYNSAVAEYNKISQEENVNTKEELELEQKQNIAHMKVLIFNCIIPCLWLIGIIIYSLILTISMFKLKSRTKGIEVNNEKVQNILEKCKKNLAVKRDIKIYEQSFKKSPCLIGIVEPKLIVTNEFINSDNKTIEYVIFHELAHYKRKDYIYNFILIIINVIHWFNPLVWVFLKKIRQDMELAADEIALENIEDTKAYGKTLINASIDDEGRNFINELCFKDEEDNLTRRIKMIKLKDKFKKHRFVIAMGSVLIILIVSMFCFINLRNEASIQNEELDTEINNNQMQKDEYKTLNITKTNEISKYIPKNITKIIATNYQSNLNDPTQYVITDIEQMNNYINLFFETSWVVEEPKNYISNGDATYYTMQIIGDTNLKLDLKGFAVNGMGKVEIITDTEKIKYNISYYTYQKIISYNNKIYYLHQSNLEQPSQDKCYVAQEKALKNLEIEQKEYIQKQIRYQHIYLEYELLDAVKLIKDSNSPYWEEFTEEGVFTDPYTGTGVQDSTNFLSIYNEILKIRDIIKDEDTKKDFYNLCNVLKKGMDEHNLDKCFEAHEILHDYDYWIINTPVHLDSSPADWGGVYTYFGRPSIM